MTIIRRNLIRQAVAVGVVLLPLMGCGSTPSPARTPVLIDVIEPGHGSVSRAPGDVRYSVTGAPVSTSVFLPAGQTIRILASGQVAFSGGFLGAGRQVFDPNGSNDPAPSGFAGPGLRKFSLLCAVGGGPPIQCGTDTSLTPTLGGVLTLMTNDDFVNDNNGSWSITIQRSAGAPIPDFELLPAAGIHVNLTAPWPGEMRVRLNGADLAKIPEGAQPSASQTAAGFFTMRIPATGNVDRWEATVVPAPALRTGRGVTLEFLYLSAGQVSPPLVLFIGRKLRFIRGTSDIAMAGCADPGDSTMTLRGNTSDPPGVIGALIVSVGPLPSIGLGFWNGMPRHEDATGATSDGRSLQGMQLAGYWEGLITGLPTLDHTLCHQPQIPVEWVSPTRL